MIREHDSVVLKTDVPEYGLKQGDIGTVVLIHREATSYEVEFMTLKGETVAVVSLDATMIRPITPREIAHARRLQTV